MKRIETALQFDVKSGHRNNVVIGCGSPDKARGKSRNTARYAAFSIQATSFGGSDGMAYAMPVTLCVPPVFHTHSSCRPMWKWIGSCSKAQLDSSMSTNLHKVCKKCGGTEFYASRNCKACSKEYSAARYVQNKEQVKDRCSDWKLKNSEKVREYNKEWKLQNPNKVKEQQARYREKNRELSVFRTKQWSLANPGKAKKRSAIWYKNNPDRAKALQARFFANNPGSKSAYGQNRRAKKKLAGGILSIGLAQKLFKLQKGKCPCCHEPLGDDFHMDHVIPISRGGTNTDDNIQLLRAVCNLQKHAKDPLQFMQERGFLL